MNRLYLDIETYGNYPPTHMYIGKVILIGYKINNQPTEFFKEWDLSEKKIINNILDIFITYSKSQLIGYNILHFDIPYLINRAIFYKMGSFNELFTIMSNFYNIDLLQTMLYLNDYHYNGISAVDVALRYNFPCFKKYSGGNEISQLYDKKNYSELIKHNEEDIKFNEYLFNYLLHRV